MQELEELDHTRPPSPLGSTSSLSAPEWASDGYGSSKYLYTVRNIIITCVSHELLDMTVLVLLLLDKIVLHN